MPWKEIGALFLALVVIFAFGNLWFHLVEAVLDRIRRSLPRRRNPLAWHPLPPEEPDRTDENPHDPAGPQKK